MRCGSSPAPGTAASPMGGGAGDRSGSPRRRDCRQHSVQIDTNRLAPLLRSRTVSMCGIAGVVYQGRERPVPEDLVRGMCTALRHRGPDDEGLYVRGAVGLGMRRLSIIDLSGGQQPIFNEDGSKGIVINGWSYHYG